MRAPSAPLLSAVAFAELALSLRDAHRPAPSSAEQVVAASALVREGVVVATGEGPAEPALPDGVVARRGEPQPYALSHSEDRGDGWAARNHRFEVDIHGAASMTHIDALDHFSWDAVGPLPGGSLAELSGGLVARGVLIDVPGHLDRPLEAGHAITLDEVRAALAHQRTELRPGDALYIRLGHETGRHSHTPLGAEPEVGLSIECAEWLAEAAPSVVISDAGLDPVPSEVEDLPVPWHILLLTVLGIPLVDMARLGALAHTCRRLDRWEFLSTIAPLPIRGSSGSPVNPIATF